MGGKHGVQTQPVASALRFTQVADGSSLEPHDSKQRLGSASNHWWDE